MEVLTGIIGDEGVKTQQHRTHPPRFMVFTTDVNSSNGRLIALSDRVTQYI